MLECYFRIKDDRAVGRPLMNAGASVEWMARAVPGAPVLRYTCQSLPAGQGRESRLNSKRSQAWVSYSGYSSDERVQSSESLKALARPLAEELLRQVEGSAAACSSGAGATAQFPSSGDAIGRIVGFEGEVWIRPGSGPASMRVTQKNTAVGSRDTVATGPTARARIEFIDTNARTNAGPSVINVGPDTELDIREFYARFDGPPTRRGIFEIIRGWIRAVTSNWGGDSAFSVKSGATTLGSQGTDFAMSYDPQTDTVSVHLSEGSVVLTNEASGVTRQLSAGNEITVAGNRFSPTRSMARERWEQITARLAVTTDAGAGAPPDRDRPYSILYEGRIYQTIYRRNTDEAKPRDLYYFPITLADGTPATQDGEELWGRFVRVPSADFEDQSSVEHWLVDWVWRGGRWQLVQTRGVRFGVGP